MIALEKVKAALKDLRLERVAESTGLHYNTLRDIRDNPNANPRWSTMVALDRYMQTLTEPGKGADA
jgi:hypothetical protein